MRNCDLECQELFTLIFSPVGNLQHFLYRLLIAQIVANSKPIVSMNNALLL